VIQGVPFQFELSDSHAGMAIPIRKTLRERGGEGIAVVEKRGWVLVSVFDAYILTVVDITENAVAHIIAVQNRSFDVVVDEAKSTPTCPATPPTRYPSSTSTCDAKCVAWKREGCPWTWHSMAASCCAPIAPDWAFITLRITRPGSELLPPRPEVHFVGPGAAMLDVGLVVDSRDGVGRQ